MARSDIDKLIEPSIQAVYQRSAGSHFYPGEVMAEVLEHRELGRYLEQLGKTSGRWHADEIVRKYIENKIGAALRKRDAHKIRQWESYHVEGERENRYMRFGGLNLATLRAAARQARTQERQFKVKGEGYQFFIDALERRGPNATVDDVYDEVLPLILRYRSQAGAA